MSVRLIAAMEKEYFEYYHMFFLFSTVFGLSVGIPMSRFFLG